LPTGTAGLEIFLLIENCRPGHNCERYNSVGGCAFEGKPVKEEKSGLAALIEVLAPELGRMYCLIHLAARKYCTGCVRMKPVKFEYVEF
jgi:hypothetical protein